MCLGRNHISGVDSSNGNTVDLEGTGNEEDALVQMAEENDAFAAETTCQEYEDGAGCERFSKLGWSDALANLYWRKRILE